MLQALYKFHFYRGELQQTLGLVFQSLIKAAAQVIHDLLEGMHDDDADE